MVATEIFPELKARGFFTDIGGREHYFSGLQKMEIVSAYKSFYEEYDLAFSVKCLYSVCDCKTESRWIRLEGNHHIYKTPVLYLIRKFDLDLSPSQIAKRMIKHYRANVLVLESYNHQNFQIGSLKNYLSAYGIYLIQSVVAKNQKPLIRKAETSSLNHQTSNDYELV